VHVLHFQTDNLLIRRNSCELQLRWRTKRRFVFFLRVLWKVLTFRFVLVFPLVSFVSALHALEIYCPWQFWACAKSMETLQSTRQMCDTTRRAATNTTARSLLSSHMAEDTSSAIYLRDVRLHATSGSHATVLAAGSGLIDRL
jgi:hypothetical protein